MKLYNYIFATVITSLVVLVSWFLGGNMENPFGILAGAVLFIAMGIVHAHRTIKFIRVIEEYSQQGDQLSTSLMQLITNNEELINKLLEVGVSVIIFLVSVIVGIFLLPALALLAYAASIVFELTIRDIQKLIASIAETKIAELKKQL